VEQKEASKHCSLLACKSEVSNHLFCGGISQLCRDVLHFERHVVPVTQGQEISTTYDNAT